MKAWGWKLWSEVTGKDAAEEGDNFSFNGTTFVVDHCDAEGVHLVEVIDDDDCEDDDDTNDDE